MTCSQRAYAQAVYIVLHSLLGSLFRSLEQRSHIHVEAAISITRCYNLGTTVVTVLTHLGNHDTRLTTFFLGKLCRQTAGFLEVCVVLCS